MCACAKRAIIISTRCYYRRERFKFISFFNYVYIRNSDIYYIIIDDLITSDLKLILCSFFTNIICNVFIEYLTNLRFIIAKT